MFLGFPAIIVSISLAVTQTNGYGSKSACWLDMKNGLIWTFIAPALFVILVGANYFAYSLLHLSISELKFIEWIRYQIILYIIGKLVTLVAICCLLVLNVLKNGYFACLIRRNTPREYLDVVLPSFHCFLALLHFHIIFYWIKFYIS